MTASSPSRFWAAVGSSPPLPPGAALAGAGVVLTDRRYVGALAKERRLVLPGPPVVLSEGYYFVRKVGARNPRHVDCMLRWLVSQSQEPAGVGSDGG